MSASPRVPQVSSRKAGTGEKPGADPSSRPGGTTWPPLQLRLPAPGRGEHTSCRAKPPGSLDFVTAASGHASRVRMEPRASGPGAGTVRLRGHRLYLFPEHEQTHSTQETVGDKKQEVGTRDNPAFGPSAPGARPASPWDSGAPSPPTSCAIALLEAAGGRTRSPRCLQKRVSHTQRGSGLTPSRRPRCPGARLRRDPRPQRTPAFVGADTGRFPRNGHFHVFPWHSRLQPPVPEVEVRLAPASPSAHRARVSAGMWAAGSGGRECTQSHRSPPPSPRAHKAEKRPGLGRRHRDAELAGSAATPPGLPVLCDKHTLWFRASWSGLPLLAVRKGTRPARVHRP